MIGSGGGWDGEVGGGATELDAVPAGAAAVNSLAGRQQQLVVVRSWFLMMSWMHCLVLKVGSWERGGWVGRRESG